MILDRMAILIEVNRGIWSTACIMLLILCIRLIFIRFKLSGNAGISISIILIDALVSLILLSIFTTGSLFVLFIVDISFPPLYIVSVGTGWLIVPTITLVRIYRWLHREED